ncbi:hypothetical protein BH20ACI2_BH20ACI2_28130 [soil metagenome]
MQGNYTAKATFHREATYVFRQLEEENLRLKVLEAYGFN